MLVQGVDMPVQRVMIERFQVAAQAGAQSTRPAGAAQVDVMPGWKWKLSQAADAQANGIAKDEFHGIAAGPRGDRVHAFKYLFRKMRAWEAF